MIKKARSLVGTISTFSCLIFSLSNCSNGKNPTATASTKAPANKIYPHEVIPFMTDWKILLGDGTRSEDIGTFQKDSFFYVDKDAEANWVVYKAPNAGVTSKTSSNTRSELHQKKYWKAQEGGKLTGTLKVMHVSTSGNPERGSAHSVVVGQIHSDDGNENEPLKIFYKKYPSHTKGSVFWNYEINTEGDNAGRWDNSTAVWGLGRSAANDGLSIPDEPQDGIELGETFSYEVNVYEGIMYLTFSAEGHETKSFTKSLVNSEFTSLDNMPERTRLAYSRRKRKVGVERPTAYQGELLYFKQGAYNQTNAKNGGNSYDGDIDKQYDNGDYVEVWFKSGTIGPAEQPLIK